MNKHDKGDSQTDIDPSDLTIRAILECLRPSHIWSMLTASALVLAIAFTAGMHIGKLPQDQSDPVASMNAVDAAKIMSPVQREIRARPAVVAWETFLEAAGAEQWDKAWDYLGEEWRKETIEADNLAYEYRRLKANTFHYYIPVSITDTEEHYLVDYEYEDIMCTLPQKDAVVNGPMSASLNPEVYDMLLKDYECALRASYMPPDENTDVLDVIRRAAAGWTIRDLVLNDSVLERLGKALEWTPILPSYLTGAGERGGVEDRRLIELVMVKESESAGWRLKSYDSLTMRKR